MSGLIDQAEAEHDPDRIKISRIRIGIDGTVTYKRTAWGCFITVVFDRELIEFREIQQWLDLIRTEYTITDHSAISMIEHALVVLAE